MRHERRLLLDVFALAIALYAITLGGTFVYDDVAVVLTDRRIANPAAWGEYWTDSYNFGVDNLYRPLVSMTYAIQHRLHGQTAWPYHAINIALHATTSVMVGWFAMRLADRSFNSRDATPSLVPESEVTLEDQRRRSVAAKEVGLIAGLLFAAHPVHVEAVANIVGRAELMCAIATLLAITLALSPLTKPRVIAIWLACAVAILCKEQGLLAAVMVGVVRYGSLSLWERAGVRAGDAAEQLAVHQQSAEARPSPQPSPGGRGSQNSLGSVLFLLLMLNVAAIVIVRENLIGLKFWWDARFLDPWIQPLADSRGLDRWLAPVTIAGRYLGLLVAPTTLRIDYGGPIVPGVVDPRDPYFWLGVIAIVLWFALLGFAWLKRDRVIGINLALFAIAYALVSNWPTIIGVNVAERLMYLPSAFFVIIIAALVVRLPRRVMITLVALVTLLYSIRTVTYAYQWNDRLRLYEYAARVEPRSMKAALLAMQEHADRGDLEAAERYARRALAIDSTYDDAWLRLAGVLIDKGDLDAAQEAIEKARAIRMTGRVGAYQKRLDERRVPVPSPGTPGEG